MELSEGIRETEGRQTGDWGNISQGGDLDSRLDGPEEGVNGK